MTATKRPLVPIPKTATRIPGFDIISLGGLPEGRTTLVAGSAGSAKTVFASQFLAAGIELFDQPGVFITFEESIEDIRGNMRSLGWDIERWEREGKWLFVDASPDWDVQTIEAGAYDIDAFLARMKHAIEKIGAQRVSIDSLGAVFTQFEDKAAIRRMMLRTAWALKKFNVTAVLTAERADDGSPIRSDSGAIEDFVADNVIILRNGLEDEKRRRTIEILKFRGTPHQKGAFSFSIMPGEGIIILPLSAIELKQRSSNLRISTGNQLLDEMCGGGFFRDSVVLISGATGTGKTLMVSHFLGGGAAAGERCLLFAFEESREQFIRNAEGWSIDIERMESEGNIRLVCVYPEVASLEDHLISMKQQIEEFRPHRVAVDSLSALERIGTHKTFREFVIGLTSHIKHHETAGVFTTTTATLLGGDSITEAHISSLTDSIVVLRYVEMYGEMRRGLTVLKMRGSRHDKRIREFNIDDRGMHIGKAFRQVSGILAGNPQHYRRSEVDEIGELFADE
ncbi:MAG: circadian clock protein KaiC [Planctomycetia bacterium]